MDVSGLPSLRYWMVGRSDLECQEQYLAALNKDRKEGGSLVRLRETKYSKFR